MKFGIFISVVLLVFGSAGFLVYTRMIQAFSGTFLNSKITLVFYIFLLTSFFAGKIVEHYHIGLLSTALVRIGSVSAAFFVYTLLLLFVIDIVRLANYIFPFYPGFIKENYEKTKLIIGISTFAIVSLIFFIGYINARNPKIKTVEIQINKPDAIFDELNIVAVSDIHLGTMVNTSKAKRLANKINELNPDIVLIGGDIIDDNIKVVKHFKLLEELKKIKSKYGVYSCFGNHEYISKAYTDLNYFKENGIIMLRDSTVNIDNKFYVIGRDDIHGGSVWGKNRKSLDELIKETNSKLPVIVLDHQPYNLAEVAEHPVSFQFSGHTHNGQIWPFNFITGSLFEQDWGSIKKKDTEFYISSGYGTAVVPIRVGNDSEIVNIKMHNNKNQN